MITQEQPTPALRWLVTGKTGIREPKLQQVWQIVEFGDDHVAIGARTEWRDVPTEFQWT